MAYLEVRKRRLNKVLNHIKQNPQLWNQSQWECGTVACFCGWGKRFSRGFGQVHCQPGIFVENARDNKNKANFSKKIKRLSHLLSVVVKTSLGSKKERLLIDDDMRLDRNSYPLFGAFYFRLNSIDANQLFDMDNSLHDLESLVVKYTSDDFENK